MKTLLVQLAVVACSLAVTYGIDCRQCIETTEGACSDSTSTCSGTYCAMTATTTNGQTLNTYQCLPTCTDLNTNVGGVETDLTCCQTDMCNAASDGGNSGGGSSGDDDGLKCYSCAVSSGSTCTEERTCIAGVETQCMYQMTEALGQKTYYWDCASACVEAESSAAGTGIKRTCCDTNLCNSGAPRDVIISVWLLACVTLVALCSVVLQH